MTDQRPTRSADASEATSGVAALIALIQGSDILQHATDPVDRAPAGYDATDIRILDWIMSQRSERVLSSKLAA